MFKANSARGKIADVILGRKIFFNGKWIERAIIEIDHINYGLDKRTHKLNIKQRTNFSVKDVLSFIYLLHQEELVPVEYKQMKSRFALRIDCPVSGCFYDKEFLMIFETDYESENSLHTITLMPNW